MPGPRVLVVRFSSLGDVLLTTPLLRAVATRYPAADITFVTREAYAPLLATNPHVTRLVALRPGERVRDLAAWVRARPYDVRLDLHRSMRSRLLRALVPGRWTSYPKDRATRLALLWLGHEPRVIRSVVDRYFAAAAALNVQPDGRPPEVFPAAEDVARAAAIAPTGCVALAPGASRATKRWPPAHWRRLAERLAARGFPVVAVGGAKECQLLSGDPVIAAYGLPLLTTAAILGRARVVVANDSGLMHLAAAAGRPIVALFGPTVPAFGFLPYRVPATLLERPLPCRPCAPFGSDHCPLGHHRCMIDIDPDTVARTVEAAA